MRPKFDSTTKLTVNRWHILEPTGNETVEIGKLDAVLVPLLCFDERGFRVGYGKGFYDKFLKNCRRDCLKIGLSYFTPVEEIAAELNAAQPRVMPGSQDVPVYSAMKYAKSDYIGRQAREQNGNRDADRRVIHIG